MKSLAYSPAFFWTIGVAAGQTDTKAKADFHAAAHWFDYDSKQPLNIHEKVIEEFDGGTLHNITFESPKGGPVDEYLVVPTEKSLLPPFSSVIGEMKRERNLFQRPKSTRWAGTVSLIPHYLWDPMNSGVYTQTVSGPSP